jgi:hypothetical protein
MSQPLLQYATPTPGHSVRRLLIRWEKLRLLYNAILIATVLIPIGTAHATLLMDPRFWLTSIASGLAANVCFCLGPYADLWLHEWKPAQDASTAILFALGLVFSLGVTALGDVGFLFFGSSFV